MTRILIVDDDPLTQRLLYNLLRRAGYEAALTDDGTHALEVLAEDSHFDAIISDIRMPKMDGFHLLDHLAAHYPNIPVVISSVTMTPATLDEVNRRGAKFLARPFTLEALKQALAAASV